MADNPTIFVNGLKVDEFELSDTVWDDMVSDLFGRRLLSTAGKVDYDYGENAIVFSSGGSISTANDRVCGNQQILHKFKIGAVTFKPHIHWFQDAATAYELTLQYRHQVNGVAQTTEWTPIELTAGGTSDVWTYPGSGVFNQITRFPSISLTVSPSDTIQFQMARTDSLGGSMAVYFMDMHGEIDTMGSRTEYTK